MAEYTLEQKQAIAKANARMRMQQSQVDTGSKTSVVEQKRKPLSGLETGVAAAQALARGVTSGLADDIGYGLDRAVLRPIHGIQTTVRAMQGKKPVPYDQFIQPLKDAKVKEADRLKQFTAEHPVISGGLEIGGGIATGAALTKFAQAKLPAFVKWAAANPYKSSAGIGALQGAVYGAGTSEKEGAARAFDALSAGAFGAVAAPALVGISNKVGQYAPKIAEWGKGKLKSITGQTSDDVGSAVAKSVDIPLQNIDDQFSTVTNESIDKITAPKVKDGLLRLPSGVRKKDTDLLRVEENARQGLLGKDAQMRIQQIDQSIDQDTRNAIQSMLGKRTGESTDLLIKGVEQYRKIGTATKERAQALYDIRDKLMADAVLNPRKVNPSLGASLNNVTTDPRNIAQFKSKAGAPARALYDDLVGLLETSHKSKELPFVDLAAWRSDVANLAIQDQGTAGTLAKRMASAYDEWMDNISDDAFISGQKEAAETARAASSAWRQYKKLFDPDVRVGNDPVLGRITKQFEKTPSQFLNEIYGSGMSGNPDTASVVKSMLKVIPEEAQQPFKDDIFSGLVLRGFEKATKNEKLSYPVLRNSLRELRSSETYKTSLATKERDEVIDTLVKELSDYINQTSRTDIRSPSAGHMGRILGLIDKLPVAGKMTFGLGQKAAEGMSSVQERRLLDQSLKEYTENLKGYSKARKISDSFMTPMISGVAGGIYGANKAADGEPYRVTVQPRRKEQ